MAGEHNGVIATQQLKRCGVDRDAIRVRVARGGLHPVFHGVYAVGHAALTQTGLFTAAVLACGRGAVLGHRAAAAYHGLLEWEDRDIQVIVPRSAGRKIDGIRAHRQRLDERDVWTRDNMRVTSPARTILDLAATTAGRPLRRIVRQALAEGRVSIRQLTDVVDCHRGHRGAGRLRRLVADGYVPARSELEDRALDRLGAHGIPPPEVNVRLELGGRRIRPDLLWRDRRVVVELDGRRWHSDPLSRQDDDERQALLEAQGYRVLRITWRQLVGEPARTLKRIRSALSDPAAPPAAAPRHCG